MASRGNLLFSFGVISDVQYADIDDGTNYTKTQKRYYRNSIQLLQDAITIWNSQIPKLSFAIQLGDLIDGFNNVHEGMSQSSWDKCISELKKFDGRMYHVFGNHDFYNFSRLELVKTLSSLKINENAATPCGLGSSSGNSTESTKYSNQKNVLLRYTFSPHEKFVFISLDSYEVSMLGHHVNAVEYIQSETLLRSINPNEDLNDPKGMESNNKKYVKFNGSLGNEQLEWLDAKLTAAEKLGQKVFIIGHLPMYEPATDAMCLLWDCDKALSILHKHNCTVAVISGHDHHGGYAVDDHGIHHITMPGIIEADSSDQAYAIVEVYTDKVQFTGIGSRVQSSVTIPLTWI